MTWIDIVLFGLSGAVLLLILFAVLVFSSNAAHELEQAKYAGGYADLLISACQHSNLKCAIWASNCIVGNLRELHAPRWAEFCDRAKTFTNTNLIQAFCEEQASPFKGYGFNLIASAFQIDKHRMEEILLAHSPTKKDRK